MNVLGIVAEYNPFHNGHKYHLEKAREKSKADIVVAVISGNFTQRGEPAILDKWTRSRLAIESGVDLVLEIPFVFACNSAEYFARGGVEILNGLGCITHIGFGSESGSLDQLKSLSHFLLNEGDEFKKTIQSMTGEGVAYARARELTTAKLMGVESAALLCSPNNILAIEYLKQLIRLDSSIEPVIVQRKGTGHLDEHTKGSFASGTALRNNVPKENIKEFVPEAVAGALKEGALWEKNFFDFTRQLILREDCRSLRGIFMAKEGIENKLKKEVVYAKNLQDLIRLVKSKRYPETRIKRLLCHTLMGMTHNDFYRILQGNISYSRVLGFNRKGSSLLKKIKQEELLTIPVITNINKEIPQDDSLMELSLSYDVLAGDMYNLLVGRNLYDQSDHVRKPVCLD
ncbi:MAG: nucleotidyltransferase [Anaerovoracaceae bacterium]